MAVKRERKKSPGSAACLQQSGARIPQGRGREVDEDRETSPLESESSEQGECQLVCLILESKKSLVKLFKFFTIIQLCVSPSVSFSLTWGTFACVSLVLLV